MSVNEPAYVLRAELTGDRLTLLEGSLARERRLTVFEIRDRLLALGWTLDTDEGPEADVARVLREVADR